MSALTEAFSSDILDEDSHTVQCHWRYTCEINGKEVDGMLDFTVSEKQYEQFNPTASFGAR